MTAFSTSLGTSRIHSGAGDVLYVPRDKPAGRKLVVLCHGYLGTARVFLDDPPSPNSAVFIHSLAQAGFTMAAVDVGNTWGNATATARIEEARIWAAANLGTDATSILLVGVSMGHLTAQGYRRDYPSKVAGIAGIMPACDLNDIRNNDRASSRSSIDTGWGVTYPSALPAGADPQTNVATLAGVPWAGFYSTGDTVVIPATVTTFAAGMGGPTTVCGSTDHGDAIMPNVPVAAVAQQLAAWGA